MLVTKIEKTESKKPRVCAYVRVSTNKEEQEYSFARQSQYWEDKFKDNPEVEYVGLFTDDGISGRYMRNRKGLNDMLTRVRNKEIDQVYTKSISRFARNYTEITAIIREFRDMGVPIIFEKENINTLDPKSGLILSVMSSLAEQELVSMSKNQAWATRKRFANGEVEVSPMYGYDVVDGKLVVNQEMAKVVRKIYDLYLKGNGAVKICKLLQAEGIKTLSGKTQWRKSTIVSILRNEKYIGDSLLQKCYYDKKVKKMNTGDLPQYYIEDTHEAIIAREDYETVQKILNERVSYYHPSQAPYQMYPLSGKIVCGNCGGKYARKVCAKGKSYETVKWCCRLKNQMGKSACHNTDIKDEVITKLLVEAYNESLDTKFTIPGIADEEKKLQESLATEQEIRVLHARGYISESQYKQECDRLLVEIRELEDRIKQFKERNLDINKYKKSAVFNQDMADFLVSATIKDWAVTYEFLNGYKTTKTYTNGRAGNVNGKLCKH